MPSYFMTILAKDGGNPTLSTLVNILIDLRDEQDNPPVFVQDPYTIFVTENTKKDVVVGTVIARDNDVGNPNPVQISLVDDPKSYFQIGNTVPNIGMTYKADVISNGNIDRETSDGRYRVNISVTEISNGALDRTAMAYSYINIEILDDNDFPPVFQHSTYNMTFYEIIRFNDNSTIIGTPMLVYDKDSNINAMFSIEITSQSFLGVFGLSTKTGIKSAVVNLVVLKPQMLDYDTPSYRKQTVQITARQINSTKLLSSSTTVYINLLDKNDNAPVFQKAIYKASLPENSALNFAVLTLLATDRDSGDNKKIVYKLNGQGNDYFSVNNNGVVSLKKKLDYEKVRTYNLMGIAENIGKPIQISSVEVEIQITDVNDNGPIFKQPYTTDITENTTILQPPIKVLATDKDSNTVMTYRIIGGNTNDNAFIIDSITGLITVKRPLMMEDAPQNSSTIFLTVLAADNGASPQSSSTVININIIDINNHKPVFLDPTYEKSVNEFTPGGTSVVTVKAVDKDLGTNAQISYSIRSGSFDEFQINPNTGRIYIASQAVLDYDKHPTYTIQVVAEDQGTPRLSGSTTLIIKLIDINNKKPKFKRSEYIKTVDEKTSLDSIILTVYATDKDNNSKIEYAFSRNTLVAQDAQGRTLSTTTYRNAFAMNRVTGEISLKTKLYHSLVATISFEVQARDLNADASSNQVTQARVVIITQASQRTQPFFLPETPGQSKKVYKLKVSEDKPVGVFITAVRAKDPKNDQFVSDYILAPGGQDQRFFNITKNGEVILNKELDYENKKISNPLKFDIIAIAADSLRSATAGMEITITDINDNLPIFNKKLYDFTVTETTRYPNEVGQVMATDNDQSDFNKITYSLEGLNRKDFQITESGTIIVSRGTELDYETRKIYLLQVVATDNPTGHVKQKTAVKLTIRVIDANDNTPVFQPRSEYIFNIREDTSADKFVGKVTATDKDSDKNANIHYTFQPEYNDENILKIEQSTGKITTAIDFLKISPNSSYTMTVLVSDQGSPPLTAKAKVTVVIDFLITKEPRILLPKPGQNASVTENLPRGTFVFKVNAKVRKNSSVIYSLDDFDKEISDCFAIESNTGNITTKKPLDREIRDIYKVVIIATDELNTNYTSRRQLRVIVKDVDDNRPSFTCPSLITEMKKQVNIPENSPIRFYVTRVSGCDDDLNQSKEMAYVWADSENCTNTNITAFHLDTLSGLIETNISLDFEKVTTYRLCVRVVKISEVNTSAPLIKSDEIQEIMVNVQDTNDNGPTFDVKERISMIYEKSPSGLEVAKVTGKDTDSFLYNKVKYSIEKILCDIPDSDRLFSTDNAFMIDRNDGRILTNLPNYIIFVRSKFTLTIRAEDALDSNFYSTMKFLIYVIQPRQQTRLLLPGGVDVNNPKSAQLIDQLNKLNIGNFVIKELNYQQKASAGGDYLTDMCFVVEKDSQVLSLSQTEELLKQTAAQNILKNYTSTSVTSSCKPETTRFDSWSAIWWVLIAFAIFIFICCIILIVIIFLLYRSHKRFMETENTSLLN